ncbi:MAG: M28 family peptidase [Nannocystaceae bacterium]
MRGRIAGLLGAALSIAACGAGAGTSSVEATTATDATAASSTTADATTGDPTTGDATSLGATSSTTADDASTGETDSADSCADDSPEGLMACVDLERYVADLEFIADVRVPGSPHWLAVQERCADVLELAGFDVSLQEYPTGVNVIGVRSGREPALVLGAHYDHIPDCPGADDNASGVAGVLEIARVLGAAPLTRALIVACWDEEELGLRGSKAHAAALDGVAIEVAVNFDMIGYASDRPGSQVFPGPLAARFPALAEELAAHEHRGDFIAITADASAEAFAQELEARAESIGRLAGIMTLTSEEKLGDDFSVLALSDHASFWARDVPAIQVFDTGLFRNPSYHCGSGYDTVGKLDHGFASDVLRATVGALATIGLAR